MEFLLALVLSFVPAFGCAAFVYWLDRYEKEPKLLLGLVFAWGAVVAVMGAVIAQLALGGAVTAISGSERAADVAGSTLFAPLTEESLKGLAVLAVFLLLRREFDSLLDGFVYAAIVALGFGATENVLYLYGAAEEGGISGMLGLFGLRIVMGIWDHPFYTSFIGLGLAFSRLSRQALVVWTAPVFGWLLACFFHGLHNTLAVVSESSPFFLLTMFVIDWAGWFFLAVLVFVLIRQEGHLLARELGDEVRCGLMSAEHYQIAISSWKRTGAKLRALPAGRFLSTRRFYQLCGELAHKKNQLAQLGEEGSNSQLIQQIRSEIWSLGGQAQR